MGTLDPIACTVFLLVAFTLAGGAQTAWFKSARSRPFMVPLDGGVTLRGRRIFGANKNVLWFLVMVPATAASFAVLALWIDRSGLPHGGVWPLSLLQYAALGAWAGFGFMAGELPNSFVKRQLDIPDGQRSRRPAASAAQFAADRLDSGVGMLVAMTLFVPVPALTWAYVLVVGPFIHWWFSVLMFRLGIKPRAA